MLFSLKKLIGSLLMPIPLTLLGITTGLLLLKRRPKTGKALILAATILLSVTSWNPIANQLIAPFENDYPRFDDNTAVTTVVVLGGCHNTNARLPPAAQLCGSSLYRLMEGIRILNLNPQARLFLSGYAGHHGEPLTHAEVSRQVAVSFGIPDRRIEVFPEARDTEQEARLMAPQLRNQTFALVSEASHLPRAMAFFQAQGLQPIAAPASQLASQHPNWKVGATAQAKSERAFYELLGRLWQAIKGV